MMWCLSPAAAWFIFFNAVVGAIAVMSSCTAHQPDGGPTPSSSFARRRLCRCGSSMVLDRLRSFSIFFFSAHPAVTDTSAAASDSHLYCYGTREAEEAAAAQLLTPQPHHQQAPLAVAATTGETATSSAAPPTAPVALPPPPEAKDEEAEEEQDESISLDEAYALAQRLRAQERACVTITTVPAAVTRRRTKAAGEEALELELEGNKGDLNARAELFIRQFREELKLQRINSILTHALRSPTAAD